MIFFEKTFFAQNMLRVYGKCFLNSFIMNSFPLQFNELQTTLHTYIYTYIENEIRIRINVTSSVSSHVTKQRVNRVSNTLRGVKYE
jgi:hypothetical protein